jgi:hypothetical protein
MVFTIPEELRAVLDADHKLLKVLMDAVSQTMKRMTNDRRRATPGVVCVLHPYGKDLTLNPHVHALATEGGLTKSGEWVPVTFLEYGKLRRIWQYELLTNLKQHMPRNRETSQLIDALFKQNPKGFYIYAKRRVTKARKVARYIGRYLRHPAIAESRMINLDRKTETVTFWYQRDDVKQTVTLPILEFIHKLVRLIPDKHLKLVRYYGLYARRTRNKLQKILTPLSKETPTIQPNKPPILCPRCGSPMKLISITLPT